MVQLGILIAQRFIHAADQVGFHKSMKSYGSGIFYESGIISNDFGVRSFGTYECMQAFHIIS